jgi:hypothetical protein
VDAEEKAETPWAQQEAFEAEQIKKASTAGFGAKDKKSKAGECGCQQTGVCVRGQPAGAGTKVCGIALV